MGNSYYYIVSTWNVIADGLVYESYEAEYNFEEYPATTNGLLKAIKTLTEIDLEETNSDGHELGRAEILLITNDENGYHSERIAQIDRLGLFID